MTNDSGFLTSHQSLSNYSTLANTIKSLSISGKTITYTKGDNSTGTLTTQDNNTWTAMVGATSSSNGSVGYVNAVPPKDGYNTKYLRADGTWQVPPDHTYTVNNATLTIQQNGTTVDSFSANSSSDKTVDIQCVDLTSNQTIGGIKTFSNAPVVGSIDLDGKIIDTDANGNMTYDSHIVDTIEEQGNGYIRYSNGLQICWGQISCSIDAGRGITALGINVNVYWGTGFVNFGSAFKAGTSPYCTLATIDNRSGVYGQCIWTISNTQVEVEVYGSLQDVSLNVQYIAIGRWK